MSKKEEECCYCLEAIATRAFTEDDGTRLPFCEPCWNEATTPAGKHEERTA